MTGKAKINFVCQYHSISAPKYRRKERYEKSHNDIWEIPGKQYKPKGEESIEAEFLVRGHLLISGNTKTADGFEFFASKTVVP